MIIKSREASYRISCPAHVVCLPLCAQVPVVAVNRPATCIQDTVRSRMQVRDTAVSLHRAVSVFVLARPCMQVIAAVTVPLCNDGLSKRAPSSCTLHSVDLVNILRSLVEELEIVYFKYTYDTLITPRVLRHPTDSARAEKRPDAAMLKRHSMQLCGCSLAKMTIINVCKSSLTTQASAS